MLGKGPFRLRSEKYLRHVRSKPCLICGDRAEAHHLTFAQPRAKALKTGDQYTVPLCHRHHMELHESPLGERTWWSVNAILPMVWAEETYEKWRQENGKQSEHE